MKFGTVEAARTVVAAVPLVGALCLARAQMIENQETGIYNGYDAVQFGGVIALIVLAIMIFPFGKGRPQ